MGEKRFRIKYGDKDDITSDEAKIVQNTPLVIKPSHYWNASLMFKICANYEPLKRFVPNPTSTKATANKEYFGMLLQIAVDGFAEIMNVVPDLVNEFASLSPATDSKIEFDEDLVKSLKTVCDKFGTKTDGTQLSSVIDVGLGKRGNLDDDDGKLTVRVVASTNVFLFIYSSLPPGYKHCISEWVIWSIIVNQLTPEVGSITPGEKTDELVIKGAKSFVNDDRVYQTARAIIKVAPAAFLEKMRVRLFQ